MQERRTTVRCECLERARYRSDNDPTLREGRLTTVTERGLGLLAHEPHRVGEQLTLSFMLPGEDETVTTTGVVRWVSQTTDQKRWYLLGLEWLALEETTRFRLDTFLRTHSETRRRAALEATQPLKQKWWRPYVVWSLPLALLGLGILIVLLLRFLALWR